MGNTNEKSFKFNVKAASDHAAYLKAVSGESCEAALRSNGEMRKAAEDRPGSGENVVSTGLTFIDNLLGGGLPEDGLTVFAARPDVDLLQLALLCADNISKSSDKPISIFSAAEDKERVLEKYNEISDEHCLFIYDPEHMTVSDIRERLEKHPKPAVIVVDYLMLIVPNSGDDEAIGETAGELRSIAKEMNVPVICNYYLGKREANGRAVPSDIAGTAAANSDKILYFYLP